MCGIYGFSGKPTKATTGILKELGKLNESRGKDSTGVAFIPVTGKSYLYKNAIHAEAFFSDQEVIKLMCEYRKMPYLTILGHTRFATRGAVTPKNAHPFIEGDHFFTHNGVLTNFDELQRTYKTGYEVDSQIIGYLLNKHGSIDAFKELSGSFTIPYVNMKEADNLKVAVHSQVFAYALRGDQVYYSSDIDHLKKALVAQKGFVFVDAGFDIQYSFYPVGKRIAVSEQKIEAKASYAYNYSTSNRAYDFEYDWLYWKKYYDKQHKSEFTGTKKILAKRAKKLRELKKEKFFLD